MKFFAIASIALPLINAAMLPARAATDLDLTTPLTCPLSLDKLSGSLPVQQIDVLDVLKNLINDGEIDLVDVKEAADIEKRAMVPGLHCGYTRAFRCAMNSAGLLNQCVWAAIKLGRDVQDDTSCIAAAIAIGSNLSNDCKLCFGVAGAV
ncbi:hypothetical protein CKM354_001214200 [Cercospora kikuchii]|uniref:Uncharacterized protein n=1 Tax=Cercospora kikuchii TaxID=84275 RepID=A0A9P3CUE3_9PEZI|nr:uncharacterized protein CKM354_001214200 [Cercospora kikuchii]GIZ49103.1 hypothetical protein CKM354_001214200 [Cercospora kikuchii]